jgi:hypothetical protein
MAVGPFEITKETIATVSDVLLRELLDRLLGAEARARGIPVAAIEVGGNQIAADGGVDASIAWTGNPEPADWLPCRTIYFQCKAEDMAPAKIASEMRPKGKVRSIFAELAKIGGAYVIFATDDTTKLARDLRLEAMAKAIADVAGHERITLDFFGAERIARWTNTHPGIAIWLLGEVGRPVLGWQPYGDWSAPGSSAEPYLADGTARAILDGSEVPVGDAIAAMRATLASAGGAVRLIGISGMGKTRLAEALFDDRLDHPTALPSAHAVYGDAGLELPTSPILLGQQVTMSGADAVIVVDNCTIARHNQLAQLVRHRLSRASLLTIDYDVGGEQVIGQLIALGGNSENLLEAVLAQRYPRLSDAERRHLARFSGGNARIALKIAETAGPGVDLSKLNDSEFLDRLFQGGRQDRDPAARICAEAASLVSAFYVEPGDGHESEHRVLAGIAGVAPDLFYRQIATFLEWGITQQRGPQRAVMPPPLANMLAAPLIRRSDPASLLDRFAAGPERLLAAFARRLGQLHDEPAAVGLAEALFAAGGMLGAPDALEGEKQKAFVAAAPAAPDAALAGIERALAGGNREALIDPAREGRDLLTQLLVMIAHDASLFGRAIGALSAFVIADDPKKHDSTRKLLLERFWALLSFTMAPLDVRLASIDAMIADPNPAIRQIAVEALDHMLTSSHFTSSLNLEFGARQVLTEWRPAGGDYRSWYDAAYQRVTKVAKGIGAEAKRARQAIADNFRTHIDDELGEFAFAAMQAVSGGDYWEEGWRAVTDALHFAVRRPEDGIPVDAALMERLQGLERQLRPKTLDQQFETFVLGEPWRHWHPSGREKRSTRDVSLLARAVGRAVARSGQDPRSWLERAASAEGQNSVWAFVAGLARHSRKPDALWRNVVFVFNADPETAHFGILGGVLEGREKADPAWVRARLDEIVDDPNLGQHIVRLHNAVPLDTTAVARFSRALDAGHVSPATFALLMGGRATEPIPGQSLANFLALLYEKPSGVLPALQVLHMRFYGDRTDNRAIDPALIALGRRLLADRRSYGPDVERQDHGVREIASTILRGDGSLDAARAIATALREGSADRRRYARDFRQLCALLMERFPTIALDEIVGREDVDDSLAEQFFDRASDDDGRVGADDTEKDAPILAWVEQDPATRAQRIAKFAPYFIKDNGTDALRWSPIALALVDSAPDPVSVLEAFERRFFSGAGWGPISLRFVRRRPMVFAFADHRDPRVRSWARAAAERLEDSIKRWDDRDRAGDSRFE